MEIHLRILLMSALPPWLFRVSEMKLLPSRSADAGFSLLPGYKLLRLPSFLAAYGLTLCQLSYLPTAQAGDGGAAALPPVAASSFLSGLGAGINSGSMLESAIPGLGLIPQLNPAGSGQIYLELGINNLPASSSPPVVTTPNGGDDKGKTGEKEKEKEKEKEQKQQEGSSSDSESGSGTGNAASKNHKKSPPSANGAGDGNGGKDDKPLKRDVPADATDAQIKESPESDKGSAKEGIEAIEAALRSIVERTSEGETLNWKDEDWQEFVEQIVQMPEEEYDEWAEKMLTQSEGVAKQMEEQAGLSSVQEIKARTTKKPLAWLNRKLTWKEYPPLKVVVDLGEIRVITASDNIQAIRRQIHAWTRSQGGKSEDSKDTVDASGTLIDIFHLTYVYLPDFGLFQVQIADPIAALTVEQDTRLRTEGREDREGESYRETNLDFWTSGFYDNYKNWKLGNNPAFDPVTVFQENFPKDNYPKDQEVWKKALEELQRQQSGSN